MQENGDNKTNETILKEYEKFAVKHIGNLDTFREYVDYYKKKYQLDIDIVFMHCEIDDVIEHERKTGERFDIVTFTDDMVKKTGIQEIDNEPKVLYDVFFNKVSDKPRGVIVCVVDKKNQILHASSYIIDGQKNDNDKSKILEDGNKNCRLDELLCTRLYEQNLSDTSIEDYKDHIHKREKIDNLLSSRTTCTTPTVKQQTYICYILATMFCVEMLKDGAKEFKKCIEDNQHKLPLSMLRYIQSEELDKYISQYKDDIDKMPSGEEKDKQLQYLEDIKKSMATDKNGDKINIFAIKELYKYFKENMQQAEGYENIIKSIIDGNLDNSKREDFKSNISFVKELFKYDLKHNGIIERKSWLDKALSFGEDNAKNRRINQLAKIMNHEFTRNIVDDEEGTRANKKEIFKRKPKSIRKMQDIIFDDLLNISNIQSRLKMLQSQCHQYLEKIKKEQEEMKTQGDDLVDKFFEKQDNNAQENFKNEKFQKSFNDFFTKNKTNKNDKNWFDFLNKSLDNDKTKKVSHSNTKKVNNNSKLINKKKNGMSVYKK